MTGMMIVLTAFAALPLMQCTPLRAPRQDPAFHASVVGQDAADHGAKTPAEDMVSVETEHGVDGANTTDIVEEVVAPMVSNETVNETEAYQPTVTLEDCKAVVEKLLTMISTDDEANESAKTAAASLRDQITPALKAALDAAGEGGSNNSSSEAAVSLHLPSATVLLDQLGEALSGVSLGDGLRQGRLWTLEDQDHFIRCSGTHTHNRLEEASTTSSGLKLVQGDIVHTDIDGKLWDNAFVPYCFHSAVSDGVKHAFTKAVEHVSEQVPCLSFKEDCSATPSIMVQSEDSGCWSYVGRVHDGDNSSASQTSQPLNLGFGCGLMGIAAHELLHALGMSHESSRGDRDDFLEVVGNNTNTQLLKEQFGVNDNEDAYRGSPFDVTSLMMPGARAFSTNGENTLVPRKDARLANLLGQRMGMSELDVLRLGDMYNCYAEVRPHTKNAGLATRLLNGDAYDSGQCRDSESTGFASESPAGSHLPNGDGGAQSWAWLAGDQGNKSTAGGLQAPAMPGALRSRTCAQLAEEDFCDKPYYADVVKKRCPVSCYSCLPGFTGQTWEGKLGSKCHDAASTMINFRNGSAATCDQLHQYCEHESLGERVKKVCMNTCGHCPCEDHPSDFEPVYIESGRSLECVDLKDKCHNLAVAHKCKVTCEQCPWHDKIAEWSDVDAVATPTCVRRRRLGYCYTRRRGEPVHPDLSKQRGAATDDHEEGSGTDELPPSDMADMPIVTEKS